MDSYAVLLFILCASKVDKSISAWPKILVSNDGKDIRLAEPKFSNSSADLENANVEFGQFSYQLTTLYNYVDYGSPFDISVEDKKIFFVLHDAGKKSGITGDKLVSVDIDRPKKQPKVLMKYFFPASDGIAVDWVTSKLYIYDTDTHRIEVLDYGLGADYTKPIWTVLVYKNLFVRTLIVDPLNGYMYWLNSNDREAIERAWMDGTHRRLLINIDFGFVNSFCVDSQESRLYLSVDSGSIWSFTTDGVDGREIVTDLDRPYAIATFENMLIWGDVSGQRPGVYFCNKRWCAKRENLIEKLKPFTLRIYEPRRQQTRFNPCAARNGNCSDLCLLTPQPPLQRSCACQVGIKLSDDGATCNSGPEELIIIAQRASIRVISLDTPDFTDRRIPIDNIKHAVGVDYDPSNGYVYWIDSALEMIKRVKLDGSGEEDVVVGVGGQPEGLAVDWVSQTVYWTVGGTGRIEVARIGHPTSRRILVSSDIRKPRSIVVDPFRGHLYWTDVDEVAPRIERAFLDGSARTILVQLDEGQWPNGLALDSNAGYIYWMDANRDVLERAKSTDGSGRQKLAEYESSHSWGLTILGDYIYWSDMQHRSLVRSLNVIGGVRSIVAEQLIDIMGIKGVSLSQTPDFTNDCQTNNGGCSHLCLFRPTGRICACPLGWELGADGRLCIVPQGFLVFTQEKNHDVMIASLSGFPVNLDYLRLYDVSEPFALDFHYKRKYLYWTGKEGQNTLIARACLNGSHMETVVDYGLRMGESLAIDWIAEQMYWSDADYNHIEVARLNGQSRRIIIWKNVKPRALVIAPSAGYLYWVNLKDSPTIERADLDGTNRVKFLTDVGHVSSLALDFVDQRLYWSNVDTGTISFADLHDVWSHRTIVSGAAMQPYGLALFGDRLYWADGNKQTIEMCDKNTGSNRTVLYTNQHLVKSLTAVHALKQQGWNGCYGEKKCEHLCFARPRVNHLGEFDCGCPTHYLQKNDGRSCSFPTTFFLFVQNSLLRRSTEYIMDGPLATLPYKDMSKVASLKYDPLNRTIYWMEKNNDSIIKRARDGEKKVDAVNLLQGVNPVDFTLDPITQLIFWIANSSDGRRSPSIHVNKFTDGIWKHLGIILEEEDIFPRGIACDPLRGYLFVISSDADSSVIYRCNYEGVACKTLVKENDIFTSLYLDFEATTLFWHSRKRRSISRTKNDGSNYEKEFITNVNEVASVTILKERIYFLDREGHLSTADKTRGGEKKEFVAAQRLANVRVLVAVDETVTKRLAAMDLCSRLKCSHICYVDVTSGQAMAKCGCPVGKTLQKNYNGEMNCVDGPNCPPSEWHCADGSCISRAFVCDGNPDCTNDGSDEKNCTCPRSQFACENGSPKCVAYTNFCDGVDHCADGSDEKYCPPDMRDSDGRKEGNTSLVNNRDNQYRAGLDSTLTVVIYVVLALGFASIGYGVTRWYRARHGGKQTRRGVISSTDGTTLELLVMTPSNGTRGGQQSATTTTTVEYSATCRVTHHQQPSSDGYSSIGPLPAPFGSDERPNLTGKSSSSSTTSNSSTDQRQGLINPPPSPATMVTAASSNSPSIIYGTQRLWQHGRRRRLLYDDGASDPNHTLDTSASSRPNARHSRRRRRNEGYSCNHPLICSPPPPYSACVVDADQVVDDGCATARRRTSSGRRRHNNGSRPPPSSPRSSHFCEYDPPPTPNDSSSCFSSTVDIPYDER